MIEEKQLCHALEAVLFAMGKAVEIEKLAESISCDVEETRLLLERLGNEYNQEKRGIRLKRLENSYQLCTAEEYYENIVHIASQPVKNVLSEAQMEVLAIVAYKQPVTKVQIDNIRGVKSDHAINRLLEWKLIEEVGRLNAPGHPILFATSQLFLKRFGISSCGELPETSSDDVEKWKEEVKLEVTV